MKILHWLRNLAVWVAYVNGHNQGLHRGYEIGYEAAEVDCIRTIRKWNGVEK